MPRALAILIQLLFTALYALIAIGTVLFVLPVVLLRENITLRKIKRHVLVSALLVATSLILAGCSVAVNETRNQVQRSLNTTSDLIDRGVEFARGAPPAPYDAAGDQTKFEDASDQNDLLLTGGQLALIDGAARAVETDPALVATIVEQELRWLDEDELERDVLAAVAGENTSVGLGQVRVSTAEELEQEDQTGLLPAFEMGDQARTERVRRLAANDWNVLYASAYVALLGQRFGDEGPLDLAQRYLGASPSEPQVGEQTELLDIFEDIF